MTTSDGLFPQREPGGDAFYYLLAILFGAAAAWADIKVGDLLLTAMIVVASCMLLGFLSPRKPLRWVLLIGVCIPAAEWLAYFFLSEKPTLAQIYESFLAFLPGIAGAVGGALGRGVIDNLFAENKK
jgi:hypothetical protein